MWATEVGGNEGYNWKKLSKFSYPFWKFKHLPAESQEPIPDSPNYRMPAADKKRKELSEEARKQGIGRRRNGIA